MRHLVGKWFYTISFDPGRLYPQQVPDDRGGFQGPGHRVQPPCPKAFEALNSALYQDYRENLWSKSTWVIGEGTTFYSTDFLLDIPRSIEEAIRSAELKFTPNDIGRGHCLLESTEGSSDEQITDFVTEVTMIWWNKFYPISNLRLTHLRLDFTEAYSPDGTFLGDNVVRTLTNFSHGVPADLNILAADDTVATRLHGIIVARNA